MSASFLQELELPPVRPGADEPGWLSALRRRAMDRFVETGLPTTRDEDWKFTSVSAIGQGAFSRPDPNAVYAASRASLHGLQFGVPEWSELVFINGRFSAELSNLPDPSRGISAQSLSTVLLESPGLLEAELARVVPIDQAFSALNTAFMADGAVIRVAPRVQAPGLIHLLFLTDASAGPIVTYPRILIVAGESSDVSVVETYASLTSDVYFTNAVTEVIVGQNARVEHIKIQRESERAFHVGTVEARQTRDTRFRSFSFAIGGALARTNIYSVMQGENADCTMNGLYLLHGTQHIDHQTRIEHAEPNCTSREVYKGVLDGTSHGVFNGKVFVRPEAQKTDGKQTNKNLLLSEGAKIDTKPQLEIFADDVKCTHGATVGRLDEIGMFYLESRGIGAALARRLLTYGFAADVLAEVTQDPVRAQLERLVFERLETSVR
ncbi:MAG: Fe-S cluster assembly protein SufD [Gemmatimonadota bacterium]